MKKKVRKAKQPGSFDTPPAEPAASVEPEPALAAPASLLEMLDAPAAASSTDILAIGGPSANGGALDTLGSPVDGARTPNEDTLGAMLAGLEVVRPFPALDAAVPPADAPKNTAPPTAAPPAAPSDAPVLPRQAPPPPPTTTTILSSSAESAETVRLRRTAERKAAKAAAAAAAATPGDLDVAVALESAKAKVASLRESHSQLCARQRECLRSKEERATEAVALEAARTAAEVALAEASAAEEYEQAAELSAQIEAAAAREQVVAHETDEARASYHQAETQKGEVLSQLLLEWAAVSEKLEECHASRLERAQSEVSTSRARLDEARRTLTIEVDKVSEEERAITSKEEALRSKQREADCSVAEKAASPIAEAKRWRSQEADLEAEIASLLKKLEETRERATEAEAAAEAVRSRHAKTLKKLESKLEALAAAQQVVVESKERLHDAEASLGAEEEAFEAAAVRRSAWVVEAQAAVDEVHTTAEQLSASAERSARVARAVAGIDRHALDEAEQLAPFHKELEGCVAARKEQTCALVNMEAEVELLKRKLRAAQDQQVRLDRDKRLAASLQRFAEAARVAAELKSLVAQTAADEASLADVEARIANAQSEEAADGDVRDLERKMESKQRELDTVRWSLLLELEAAVAAAEPLAEPSEATLLQEEAAGAVAARARMSVRWGWTDDGGLAPSQGKGGGGGGGVCDASASSDSEADGSDDDEPDGAVVSRPPGWLMAAASLSAAGVSLHDDGDSDDLDEAGVSAAAAPANATGSDAEESGGAATPTQAPGWLLAAATAGDVGKLDDDGDSDDSGTSDVSAPAAPAKATEAVSEVPASAFGFVKSDSAEVADGSDGAAAQDGETERAQLQRLLEQKEDAMQKAVDRDDFELATALQEEVDELADALDALE